MSWVIAISNQKGGVGKTTTCISLGACLAELGNRTLIVDLDSQANLTMAVGLDPDILEWTISDLLEPSANDSQPEISKIIQTTTMKDLDILPSDLRLASTEQLLHNQPEYENVLAKQLSRLESEYSFIMIDCPPALSALTITALTAAHFVLIPVQCEYFSARGLIRLLDVIEAVKTHTNPDLGFYLLVTMFDMRNKISQRVYEQLHETYGTYFMETIVNIDTKLRESSVVGEPIIAYSPSSRSSLAYRQLARELITNLNTKGI